MKSIYGFLLLIYLILSPLFSETLAEKYSLDKRTTYSTKGNPKAKGVNLTIKYPSFWKAVEGERPDIVQKFQYISDDLIIASMIVIVDPGSDSRSDKQIADELYVKKNLMKMLPDMYTFIDGDITTYDNLKGSWIVAKYEKSVAGSKMSGYSLMQSFIYQKKSIMINHSISHIGENIEADYNLFLKYKPIFEIMAASIVLPDQWNENGKSNKENHSTSNKSSPIFAFLPFISIIVIIVIIVFIRRIMND